MNCSSYLYSQGNDVTEYIVQVHVEVYTQHTDWKLALQSHIVLYTYVLINPIFFQNFHYCSILIMYYFVINDTKQVLYSHVLVKLDILSLYELSLFPATCI